MDIVRHHLANLCRHDEFQPGLVDIQVVDFSFSRVYRYIKGRVYEKNLSSLDPVIQDAFDQQQILSITYAETLQSPYQETLFQHQYLHIYPLKQGLVLLQQNDFHPLPQSVRLLAEAIEILLEAAVNDETVAIYTDWLIRSGMNHESGKESHRGMKYTPHQVMSYTTDVFGCYPIQAMPAVTTQDSLVYVSIDENYIDPLIKAVELPVYRFVDGYYIHISTTDKRRLNKLASTIQSLKQPYSGLIIHIVRGCDTSDPIASLQSMRGSNELYYPAKPLAVIQDIDVALARVKRYRVRNNSHQWVMTYYELPTMSLSCERGVLHRLLKEKSSTYRLLPLSEALSQHPDTLTWMTQHKMAQYMDKTGFILDQTDQALLTYLKQKSGTIGCKRWDVYFTQTRDYILLDRTLRDADSSLIELLFERQMKDRVSPIAPVRTTQDILVVTNHQLGYYYNEEDHE